jgi:hypothetical protein
LLNTDLTAITKYALYTDVQTDANGLAYIGRWYDYIPIGSLCGTAGWTQITFCSANIGGSIQYAARITNGDGQPWVNTTVSFGVLWGAIKS